LLILPAAGFSMRNVFPSKWILLTRGSDFAPVTRRFTNRPAGRTFLLRLRMSSLACHGGDKLKAGKK
jgi:hypothetical protein